LFVAQASMGSQVVPSPEYPDTHAQARVFGPVGVQSA
jgi:hypothetical protein